MEKQKIIEYITKKLKKTFCDHSDLECQTVATEIYSYMMQTEKIKKMACGKCEHDFEILEEDGFYEGFEKVKCAKCDKIKMRKICNSKQ
jgi:hypothetical protein